MPARRFGPVETRRLILQKAYELFEDLGHEKTTILDIAKACGFSAANVHKHAGSRLDINEAVAARVFDERLAGARAAVMQRSSAASRLEALIDFMGRRATKASVRPTKRDALLETAGRSGWSAVSDYRQGLYGLVRDIVRRGAEDGEFSVASIDVSTRALLMALSPLTGAEGTLRVWGAPEDWDLDALTAFLLRGLGAGKQVRSVS